jgi:hypothetical protein
MPRESLMELTTKLLRNELNTYERTGWDTVTADEG